MGQKTSPGKWSRLGMRGAGKNSTGRRSSLCKGPEARENNKNKAIGAQDSLPCSGLAHPGR